MVRVTWVTKQAMHLDVENSILKFDICRMLSHFSSIIAAPCKRRFALAPKLLLGYWNQGREAGASSQALPSGSLVTRKGREAGASSQALPSGSLVTRKKLELPAKRYQAGAW
jgi:hypothetical protein